MTTYQFGIKTLLLAMLTCSAAFGVVSWQPPGPIIGIALCVPGFWAGFAVAFIARIIPGENAMIEFVRVVCFGCGFVLAQVCVVIAIVLFVVTLSSWSP